MKMLTVFALLCARAAALPDAADEPGTQGAIVKALPDAGARNWTQTGEKHVVRRAVYCLTGWTAFQSRCFRFVPQAMSWAKAEKNCESMGGNLASVHSIQEYQNIQKMMQRITRNLTPAWIGGSDAQEERYWLWSDGTPFRFTYWCPGEPNNYKGVQHCLQMNWSGRKCWDDLFCTLPLPSVCARKG